MPVTNYSYSIVNTNSPVIIYKIKINTTLSRDRRVFSQKYVNIMIIYRAANCLFFTLFVIVFNCHFIIAQ